MVSQVRFSGPSGSADGFVQLTNVAPYAINLSDWRLAYSGGVVSLPGATVPPNGSYLIAGSAYSLGSDTAADVSPSGLDLSGGWVQLFSPAGASADTVGLSSAPAADRIGNGLAVPASTSTQDAFVRNQTAGAFVFTGDNSTEFTLVSSNPSALSGSVLGNPVPKNAGSPVVHNDVLQSGWSAGTPTSPTRRAAGNPGTLTVYRALTNCTGQDATGACVNERPGTTAPADVTRLAFRITSLTTAGNAQAGQAILEPENGSVLSDGGCATPAGSTLPLDFPNADGVGGLNSTWTATGELPGASNGTGGSLAPGDCLAVAFQFKVTQTGTFSFGYNTEDDLVPGHSVAAPRRRAATSAAPRAAVRPPAQARSAPPLHAGHHGPLGAISATGVTVHPTTARSRPAHSTKHKTKKKHKAKKHKKKHAARRRIRHRHAPRSSTLRPAKNSRRHNNSPSLATFKGRSVVSDAA